MKNFAVIDNKIVINVIIAEDKDFAESLTNKECLEYSEENPLGIGWYFSNEWNKYIPPSPYNSWIYDGQNWNSPVPKLDIEGKEFVWDEDSISWIEVLV